jgi:pyruvate dehydrogenase E2 component (dihydrolipoamide acetyltransferase)
MAGTEQVLVPDIGDFDDVPVIEVLVSVGDTVAAEDPLVVLESDKATMEVPSPSAGKVTAIEVAVGDKVKEGSPIVSLEVSGGNGAAPEAETAPPGTVERKTDAQEETAVEAAIQDEEQDAPADETPPAPPASPAVASPQATTGEAPAYASPAVRRLARELGVDLSAIRGTGRKGRITKEDVQKPQPRDAAPPLSAAPSTEVAGLNLAPWPKVNFERFGEVERKPLTRIQKISGPNLARNWVMIPHVTHNDEADITELEAFRKRTNAEQSEAKVTMVALLAKAVVASLKAFPVVNSSLDGDDLVLKRYYNIGFAADTPNGLVVPVIKDADSKGIIEIAQDLTALSKKARDGKLAGGDMQGATFTISSLGGIGGTSFTPIVNAPEVAILGVTRSAMKPVWNGNEFVPRLMVPLSLSYDHRVIDGALAARFTAHLVQQLSDLRRVLL